MTSAQTDLGSIVSLWRYPVKSMMGEELNAAGITRRGLLGYRAYGLIDRSDGKVASAKNPRKWPRLFDFRARLAGTPGTGADVAPVRITLPDGTIVSSEQPDIHQILSKALEREVTLDAIGESPSPNPQPATAEEYWPDMVGLEHRDTVTGFGLPEGAFFDSAFVHLLTTATLGRLRALYSQGRFEVRRFRPNMAVAAASGARSRRSPEGYRHPAHCRPAQSCQRGSLCLCVTGWPGPPWRFCQAGVSPRG